MRQRSLFLEVSSTTMIVSPQRGSHFFYKSPMIKPGRVDAMCATDLVCLKFLCLTL